LKAREFVVRPCLWLGFGGYAFLWLQIFAMAMGVIMLSAITYVTLCTGRRPSPP